MLDDEDVICEVVEEELSRRGYEVRSVYTGDQALQLIQEEPFDLLIVDLKLPTTVSGIDVIKFFKEHCPRAKVMVITGYSDDALEQEARAAGADAFLHKPVDIRPDVLGGYVEKVLGK